jgi:hypothetical protein
MSWLFGGGFTADPLIVRALSVSPAANQTARS